MAISKLRVVTLATGIALIALLILSVLFITGRFGHPQSRTQMSAMGHHQSGTRSGSKVRTYYIAADQVAWDYAPSGKNQITGKPFDDVANVFVKNGPDRIGHVYLKSQYRQYTDATFKHLKLRPPDEKYLGILGPVIRAEVGDTIKVVFKNNTPFPADMHPHGVFYNKDSEGAPYNDGTSGKDKSDDVVAPGKTHTYIWKVPERAGPGPMDSSTIPWMYHGHVDEPADTNAGLIGPIIIGRHGSMNPDGTFKGVDREFITLFTVFDENESPYLKKNIERYTGDPASVNPNDEAFVESNLMHSINGYVYGNMPMMTMKKGEHVRWYVMGMGTEVDLHTPHWHGNTVVINGMRTDVAELLPMSMKVADMVPDDPGIWLYHCHVNDHIKAGMITRYRVLP
jgi:FtsP/CotA-like multicopper oxidase with cupredoxin domain